MARTPIKNFYGRTIGYIEELPNGDQIIKDFYMKTLGRYDKRLNVTKNFYGRTVAQGNQLSMLLSSEMFKDDKGAGKK
jgi:hypothetical protein